MKRWQWWMAAACFCVLGGCMEELELAPCEGKPCSTEDDCKPASNLGPCRTLVCAAAGLCEAVTLTAGDCDDGNGCTEKDKCQPDGRCLGTPLCVDDEPCTRDVCHAEAGGPLGLDLWCSYDVIPNGGACDDGDPCTLGDSCGAAPDKPSPDAKDKPGQPGEFGVCIPGGVTNTCDDGEACSTDWCESDKGCQHKAVANNEPCDDGNQCTTGALCKDGACTGHQPVFCTDDDPCTKDACDPYGAGDGCVHLATKDGGLCTDDDACTFGEACKAGKCAGGTQVDCEDGNACTDHTCDSKQGCSHIANTKACTDPNGKCGTGAQCASKACVAKPLKACSDSNPCTTNACDPAKGCLYPSRITAYCKDGLPLLPGYPKLIGGITTVGPRAAVKGAKVHLVNEHVGGLGWSCVKGKACLVGRIRP